MPSHRDLIREFLEEREGTFMVPDIEDYIREKDERNRRIFLRSQVYRIIKQMLDDGTIEMVGQAGKANVYRASEVRRC